MWAINYFQILFWACQAKKGEFTRFTKIDGYVLSQTYDTSTLLNSIVKQSQIKCANSCTMDCLCEMFIFEDQMCHLYAIGAIDYLMKGSADTQKVFIKHE